MKTYEQWKEQHGITHGYPDHEMIYNGGYIEGLLVHSAELERMTAAKDRAVEALKECVDEIEGDKWKRAAINKLIQELEEVK